MQTPGDDGRKKREEVSVKPISRIDARREETREQSEGRVLTEHLESGDCADEASDDGDEASSNLEAFDGATVRSARLGGADRARVATRGERRRRARADRSCARLRRGRARSRLGGARGSGGGGGELRTRGVDVGRGVLGALGRGRGVGSVGDASG